MRMLPRRNLILTADSVGILLMAIEQNRLASAGILGNESVKEVLASTPVEAVLTMEAVMPTGGCDLLEGCSYSAMMAYTRVSVTDSMSTSVHTNPDKGVWAPVERRSIN